MQRNMPKAISRNPPLNMNMMEAFFRQGNCALQIIYEYLVSEYTLERAEIGWHVLLQESPRSPNNGTHPVTVLAEHGGITMSRNQAPNRLSGRNSGGGIVVTQGFEFTVSENGLPTAETIAVPFFRYPSRQNKPLITLPQTFSRARQVSSLYNFN